MRHASLIAAGIAAGLALFAPPAQARAPDSIRCQLEWQAARDGGRPDRYRSFLRLCPGSANAAEAKAFIARSSPVIAPPQPQPPRPPARHAPARLHPAAGGHDTGGPFSHRCLDARISRVDQEQLW